MEGVDRQFQQFEVLSQGAARNGEVLSGDQR
jgi:hypothetical protein